MKHTATKIILSLLALVLMTSLAACDTAHMDNATNSTPTIPHATIVAPVPEGATAAPVPEDIPCQHTTAETVNQLDATCSQPGYSGDICCRDCGSIVEKGHALSATGHSNTTVENAQQATCSAAGYTGDTYCKDCREIIQTGEFVPAAGHTSRIVHDQKATCSQNGYTGDTYCDECQATLSKGSEIPATGHSVRTIHEKQATCTKDGYTGDTYCDNCERTLSKGSAIPATGHGATAVRKERDVTCTQDGYSGDTYCLDCNKTLSYGDTTPATGHTDPVLVGYVEVTDTTDGYTGDLICTKCNYVFEYGTVIPKPQLKKRWIRSDGRVYEFEYMSGQSPFDYTLSRADIPSANRSCTTIEDEILRLVNEERARLGLHELRWENRTYYYTKLRTLELFESFSHLRPDGRRWYTCYYDDGIFIERGSENLFSGTYLREMYFTDEAIARRIYDCWYNSPSHREAMLSEKVESISICVINDGVEWRATQHFFGYDQNVW